MQARACRKSCPNRAKSRAVAMKWEPPISVPAPSAWNANERAPMALARRLCG